jgi:hypothetical protein
MSQFAQRYSGSRVLPFAPPGGHAHHGPGHCRSCGQASGDCRCGCRQCRKEAKELLLVGAARTGNVAGANPQVSNNLQAGANIGRLATAAATTDAAGAVTAFIGGGCCVHISVEYAPITPTVQSIVAVLVTDSEGTGLLWEKTDPPGTHYQVKENVVTTKPGATIRLIAVNATLRARWCEVFSC